MGDGTDAESLDPELVARLVEDPRLPFEGVDTLGGAIGWLRQGYGLTQAELAELMKAQGVDWRRTQVLRVESDQRDLSAHEVLVAAYVLGVPLAQLYGMAGYPRHMLRAAGDAAPKPIWSPEAIRRATGAVRAFMKGDIRGKVAVDLIVRSWRDYETRSGRPPGERAERAKRASLWREYEADPEGFRDRAMDRAIETGRQGDSE